MPLCLIDHVRKNVIDPAHADLNDFGFENGMLHWIAPIEDLRRRYIGGRVEDFLARADVHFTMEVGSADEMLSQDDEDEEDLDARDEEEAMVESFRESAKRLADGVRSVVLRARHDAIAANRIGIDDVDVDRRVDAARLKLRRRRRRQRQ